LDVWAGNGRLNVQYPVRHMSGCGMSGVVEWVAGGEEEFKKGAEVIVSSGISCGRCEKCLLGMDNQCRFYTIVGYEVDGGYAELVKVPRTNLIAKPSAMDFR